MRDIVFPVLLLAAAFAASAAGTAAYIRLAKRHGIHATPNKRSLHEGNTALGGGIVFAAVFVAGTVLLYLRGAVQPNVLLALAGGGAAISLMGYLDDVFDMSARLRFAAHIALAVFALACFGGFPPLQLGARLVDLGWAGHVLAALGLVWLINLYNFVDGIDGLAASGAVFCALAAAMFILLWSGSQPQALVTALLAACVAGFLVFNWAPARVFMGDAGSTFLGYVFGVFVLMTAAAGAMTVWTWLTLLGCFVADTGTTLLLRMWMVRDWYRIGHRSHAYQNLARVWKSHRKVTGCAVLINLFWLLPLAVWSMNRPDLAPLITVMALLPLIGISLKYGPLYSSA